MQANILVCDDDRDIVAAIAIYLRHDGHTVFPAYDGAEALRVLEEHEVQLVIMDIMMPRLNGLDALRRMRETRNIPVILLSARGEDADKIKGLHEGADDYVTKPFNPLELLARVKSQLRRYTQLGAAVAQGEYVYQVGGLVVDDEQKLVTVDGEPRQLTPIQYKILLLLIKHPGRVFSIEDIYARVWGDRGINVENTVAVHIRNLREKIEINPSDPKYLKVVWGIGYKIV